MSVILCDRMSVIDCVYHSLTLALALSLALCFSLSPFLSRCPSLFTLFHTHTLSAPLNPPSPQHTIGIWVEASSCACLSLFSWFLARACAQVFWAPFSRSFICVSVSVFFCVCLCVFICVCLCSRDEVFIFWAMGWLRSVGSLKL